MAQRQWLKDLKVGTTKESLVKSCPELKDTTFGYALPHNWVVAVASRLECATQSIIGSSFVWRYAPGDGCMGIPFAITKDGEHILQLIESEVH